MANIDMGHLSNDCFETPNELMTVSEALEFLDQRVISVTGAENIGLSKACGRILMRDLVAKTNSPPHDNSAVDGYAVRYSDIPIKGEVKLKLVGRAAAGRPFPKLLQAGETIQIFTGAPIPTGADTIAMQEYCHKENTTICVPSGLTLGDNLRLKSEDIRSGDIVLRAGHRMRAQDIGLAASAGYTELPVYSRLKVALFSTGDEVAEPGTVLEPGRVYDANRYVISALLQNLECQISDLAILPDNRESVYESLKACADSHHLIVTSGGISGSEEDHVAKAVTSLGLLSFWRLAVKPGKPVAFGQIGTTPFIGLPGNPVAATLTFLRIARPIILKLSGANNVSPHMFRVKSGFNYTKKPNRLEWIRARLTTEPDGGLVANMFESQGSGILSSVVGSDGVVELPEELTQLNAGMMVNFLSYNEVT